MLQAQIFTLYPELFPGPLNKGLYGKALSNNIWNLKIVNIRDYSSDKHKTVDDTPFGGGSGMLIKPDVLANSLDQNVKPNEKIYYLTPKGKLFSQKLAKKLSKEKTINLICGHFEGVDQRVIDTRNIEELSIGDYVLSGGETAALIVLDSILRLLQLTFITKTHYKNSKTNFSFCRGCKAQAIIIYKKLLKKQKTILPTFV